MTESDVQPPVHDVHVYVDSDLEKPATNDGASTDEIPVCCSVF
jgi:hypothetical protein